MTFAIDYDGTWTGDPEAFAEMAAALRHRGHRVLLVTARATGQREVLRECSPHADRIIFSPGVSKSTSCEELGERVDVWIDDRPEMVMVAR